MCISANVLKMLCNTTNIGNVFNTMAEITLRALHVFVCYNISVYSPFDKNVRPFGVFIKKKFIFVICKNV